MARLTIIAPYYWPEIIGSAPYCTEFAEWLAENGHSVTVLSFRPHYPSPRDFQDWADGSRDEEVRNGVRILRVAPMSSKRGFVARLMNDSRFMLHVLRRAFDRSVFEVDGIYGFVPSSLSLFGARLMKFRAGAPLIGVVHDIESGLAGSLSISGGKLTQWLIERTERTALNLTDELVVLTPGMARALTARGCRSPIRVIPLWCKSSPEAPFPSDGELVVAYSGNLGKKQNLDQLLPVIERLATEAPNVRFELRGDGSQRVHFEEGVRQKGLENVKFFPLVPAEQFMATLQAAHVHLVPQAAHVGSYAIPSKVFSVMAAGRPFICVAEPNTDLANLARTSGAGVCVAPGDADALQAAILMLAADRERLQQMGRNGRAYVVQHHQRGDILSQYASMTQYRSMAQPVSG